MSADDINDNNDDINNNNDDIMMILTMITMIMIR